MKLRNLLQNIIELDTDLEISGLSLDSRLSKQGDAFIALNGALQHGLQHAEQAIANGAVVVLYDPSGLTEAHQSCTGFNAFAVNNLGMHLGEMAARFYANPSQKLDVIGITGTNGKTTCSQLVAQALPSCGVIGTLGWGQLEQLRPTLNTTPDALNLQKMLHDLLREGNSSVAMEVSSHGLEQGRVNAVDFKGAVFTNLSRDHLDYHPSMEAYLAAKLELFKKPTLAFAVINLDDANSSSVLEVINPNVKRWVFSTSGQTVNGAECLTADQVHYSSEGTQFRAHWGNHTALVTTSLVGAFNLQNLMAVLCVLLAMNWSFTKAIARIANLKAVIGRMEKFGGKGKPVVIVDYAHTPDALKNVLLACKNSGQLSVVFGCGGNRDKGKRPQMRQIAETLADQVIVTDDNPRSEASEAIINDIMTGCLSTKISMINDRKSAITAAIQRATENDCVVIAGKGHENYQEINGIKIPFSDQDIVQQALASWSPNQ